MIENFANNKPVKEVTYLNTENSQRYRTIIQIMFKKYEQMKYWILKEEIYEIIKNIDGFENYTMDNLKQDLDSLEYWGNVITMQDTKKTRTLEEFKNRQFRYQISSVTIELERALIKIQNQKHTSRGSLEVSLIEKFKNTLIEIKKIDSYSNKEIYTWWQNLNNEFKNLNENYQDYISEFYMPKMEDILKTTKFLICDEISTMLDVITQAQIWNLLLSISNKRKIGMLVVTHNIELAKKVSSRIINISDLNNIDVEETDI